MKKAYKKFLTGLVTLVIGIQGISPVHAESGVSIDKLKACRTGKEIALLLDSLTDSEAETLGIGMDKYRAITYRNYFGELILESEFDTQDEFLAAYNNALDECITETIVAPDSLIGYVKRFDGSNNATSAPSVTFGAGGANTLRWYGNGAYYYFNIENPSAVKEMQLTIAINVAERWIKTDGYSLDTIPYYTNEQSQYTSEDEEYIAWETYEENMTAAEAVEIRGDYKKIWEEAVKELNECETGTQAFTVRCFSEINAYVSSPEYNGANLKVIYDNTLLWNKECKVSPSDGEVVAGAINEIIFDWNTDIDTDTWKAENISLYNITKNEEKEFTPVVYSAQKTGVTFECEDLCEYEIKTKNITKADGTGFFNKTSSFKIKFPDPDPEYLTALKKCTNGAEIIEVLDTLNEEEIQELGIDTDKYKEIEYKNYFGELILKSGFADTAEFKDVYNNAVNKCIEEVIIEPESLISYTKRLNGSNSATSDPNVTFGASAANTLRWYGNEAYYHFNIVNPAAVSAVYLDIHCNKMEEGRAVQTDGYSFEAIPNYSTNQIKYTSADEAYSEWEEYESGMTKVQSVAYTGEYMALWKDMIYQLQNSSEDSRGLTIRCFSEINTYVSSAEYDGAYMKIIYDNTIIWNKECKVTPGEGDIVTSRINEIVFDWNIEIDTDTWNTENVSVYDVTNDEELLIMPVVYSPVKTGISFECEDLCKYEIRTKNINRMDGTSIFDKTVSFETDFDISDEVFENINIYGDTAFVIDDINEYVVKGITDKKEGIINIQEISLKSDDENVCEITEDNKIKAKKRGTAVISAQYINSDNSKAVKSFVAAVAAEYQKNTFDDAAAEQPSYRNKSLKVSKKTPVCTPDDIFSIWFYDDGAVGKEYAGIEFELNGESIFTGIKNNSYVCGSYAYNIQRAKGWHQIFLDNINKCVYIDGEKADIQKSVKNAYAVCNSGDFWVDEVVWGNVSGESCIAQNVVIRGISNISKNTSYVGRTLTGEYAYSDKDKDLEDGTQFKWIVSSASDGEYTDTGCYEKTFTPGASYINKYIRFEVIPKNMYDRGEPVRSNAIKIIQVSETSGGTGGSGSGGSGSKSKKTDIEIVVPIEQNNQEQKNDEKKDEPGFSDIPKGHWASVYIAALTQKGIISGNEKGEFNPENNVTRAEFIKMIVMAFGFDTPAYSGRYSDVQESDWFSAYIESAAKNNIAEGNGLEFYPDKHITREEMAKIIISAYEIKAESKTESAYENIVSDIDSVSDWAAEYVQKALIYNIVKGNDKGQFLPKDSLTRAEAAAVIYRASQM